MGADAEGWAPEGETAGDEDVGVAPVAVAVALLVEVVGEEVEREELTAVGVAAEEQVYLQFIRLREVIRLVVKHHYRLRVAALLQQLQQRLTVAVHMVITPDDLHSVWQRNNAIAQQGYLSMFQIVSHAIYTTDILVISRHHIDSKRSLQCIKQCIKRLIQKGFYAIVNQVARDKDNIGIAVVYHPHIALQHLRPRAVTQVHIANGDNAHALALKCALGGNLYMLRALIAVVDISINQQRATSWQRIPKCMPHSRQGYLQQVKHREQQHHIEQQCHPHRADNKERAQSPVGQLSVTKSNGNKERKRHQPKEQREQNPTPQRQPRKGLQRAEVEVSISERID